MDEIYEKPTIVVPDHEDKVIQSSDDESHFIGGTSETQGYIDRVLNNYALLLSELRGFNISIEDNSQWRLFRRILGELSRRRKRQ